MTGRARGGSARGVGPGGDAPAAADEILLLLRLRGPSRGADLAAAGLAEAAGVADALAAHEAAGRCSSGTDGRWRLSAVGMAAADGVIAAERAALAPHLADVSERFAESNARMKEAVTDWQVVRVGSSLVPNDHSDPVRDERVLARIGVQVAAVREMLAPLAARRVRIASLLDGLAAALERARSGELRWVSGIDVDSVHTLWWRLHVEVLALLGAQRGAGDA